MEPKMPYLDMKIAMPDAIQSLYNPLMDELDQLGSETKDPVIWAGQSIAIVQQALSRLKEYILEAGFDSPRAEIDFFKYIKPKFRSQLFFFESVYRIESRRPPGAGETVKRFVRRRLDMTSGYLEEHGDWYEYLRQRQTDRDESAFLRSNNVGPGSSFSTARDREVAEILATEMLHRHLTETLAELEGELLTMLPEPGKDDLIWTGKLRFINQLIRALVKAGVINNGKIPMSKVIAKFQTWFHVDLRNYYKASQENRITEDPEDFLKLLVKVHQQDSDDATENPRYH